MKKGDLTINTMMIIVITIISIVLLLGVFVTKLPTFSKGVYCKTFYYIHSSTFVPKGLRADQDYCHENKLLEPPITLSNDVPLNISILGHMFACWKEAEYGALTENMICYELKVGPKVPAPQTILEEDLTNILIEEDLCRIFSNNDTGLTCGDSDDILWEVEDDAFVDEQSVLIEYLDGKVMVS